LGDGVKHSLNGRFPIDVKFDGDGVGHDSFLRC
jgi:hypothetical protein